MRCPSMGFRVKIEQTAKKHESNIILALDFPFERPENRNNLLSKAERVLDAAYPWLCVVKFNHHLVLYWARFTASKNRIKRFTMMA